MSASVPAQHRGQKENMVGAHISFADKPELILALKKKNELKEAIVSLPEFLLLASVNPTGMKLFPAKGTRQAKSLRT